MDGANGEVVSRAVSEKKRVEAPTDDRGEEVLGVAIAPGSVLVGARAYVEVPMSTI